MKKIDLGNKSSELIRLVDKDDPQALLFENIALDAKISLDLTLDKERTEELITTIKVSHLLEATKKISYLGAEVKSPITPFNIVTIQVNEEGQPVKNVACLQYASIPVAIDGEMKLGANDNCDIALTELQKVAQTSVTVGGGKKSSSRYFELLKSDFDFKNRTKDIDKQKADFLIFNKFSMPDEIEFMYNGERRLMSKDYIELMQKEIFGVIGYSSKGVIMGTHEVIVLDISDASIVTLRADKTATGKIDYYTVKL